MKKILKSLAMLLLAVITACSVAAATPAASAADGGSTAGVVSISSGYLNVRASADTASTVLARLYKGAYVTLVSKSGGWWRVEYAAGSYGYVYAGYISAVPGAKAARVNLSWGTLNVRSGAGTSYPVLARLANGSWVVVLSTSSGWSRILYNGASVGYVSSGYLSAAAASALTWPVPASRSIIQYFSSGTHLGIDILPSKAGTPGDTIVAAGNGTVVYSGTLSGYGYVVYINSYINGQYIQTRYGHLNGAPWVGAGQTVSAGQAIGAMGSSGNAEGPHLHFEVRIRSSGADCLANSDSTPVDPLNYVS